MMKKLLKSNAILPRGLDVVRILSGGIIVSFGFEILNAEQMAGYVEWLTAVKVPFPEFMSYVGKFSELICGFCLAIGLFTRFSSIPLMITMCTINFIMLEGSIRTEPFYLLLIFTIFFFVGGGKISVDYLIEKRRNTPIQQP
jgi:putative oxidoreductase